jgi:transcription-repair coupling factor (superfamily II helicase)
VRPAERWAGKYDHVAGERLRLEAYTRIAAADPEADVAAVRDELAGRYGPPPGPVLASAVEAPSS